VPGVWQELSTPEQIESLMKLLGNLHDGCVREIHVATGHSVGESLSMSVDWRTTVHLLVQRQWPNPSAIELRFAEVIGLMVSPPQPNSEAIIFGAAFFLRDSVFYWAEDAAWTPESSNCDDFTWVAARHVWWRDASDWMGPDLRYRQGQ